VSANLFYKTITQLYPELLEYGVISAGRKQATISERNAFIGDNAEDVESYI
jgi:hypothetical protein